VTKKTGCLPWVNLCIPVNVSHTETGENNKAQARFFIKKTKSRSQTGGWVGSMNDMWETATKTTLILRLASTKHARTTYLCNSMQHSFSQETNSYSATEVIPHLLWNLNFHYCIHRSRPLGPVSSIQSITSNLVSLWYV